MNLMRRKLSQKRTRQAIAVLASVNNKLRGAHMCYLKTHTGRLIAQVRFDGRTR